MEIVTRPLLNNAELAEWARGEGFDDLVPAYWHVTVILSRGACALDLSNLTIRASPKRSVAIMGGLFALRFRSTVLSRRHAAHREAGGEWDYDTYRPHVSFMVRDRRDLGSVHPYSGPLLFGPETPGW